MFRKKKKQDSEDKKDRNNERKTVKNQLVIRDLTKFTRMEKPEDVLDDSPVMRMLQLENLQRIKTRMIIDKKIETEFPEEYADLKSRRSDTLFGQMDNAELDYEKMRNSLKNDEDDIIIDDEDEILEKEDENEEESTKKDD